MMLRYTFDLDKEADAVEEAVQQGSGRGLPHRRYYVRGMYSRLDASKMGDLIAERI